MPMAGRSRRWIILSVSKQGFELKVYAKQEMINLDVGGYEEHLVATDG